MITVLIHEGEARGRGQLSFDILMLPWYNILYHSYSTEHELVSWKSSAWMISFPEEF